MILARVRAALLHWSIALVVVLVALLLATALVVRLSATLRSTEEIDAPGSGEVRLATSAIDGGPIFDGSRKLEPGQSIQSCLALENRTEGEDRQVTLDLLRDQPLSTPLAERLQITVERGSGTPNTSSEGSCRGFRAEQLVASDTLATLLADGATPVWRPPPRQALTHFRFTARLSGTTENALQAQSAGAIELQFVASAGAPATIWIDQAGLLLNSLARRSSLPLFGLMALAMFFSVAQALVVGDHGRRDTAAAAPHTFEPPSLA